MNPKNLAFGIVLLVVVAVFFSGCLEPSPPANKTDNLTPGGNVTPGSNATSLFNGSVVEGNNQFAIDMYSQLKANESNIFFSPFSISTALAMTYEGARGQTAEEMASVMHLSQNDTVRREGYAALLASVNKANKSYELKTANELWIQKDWPISGDYTQTIRYYYGGGANTLDFIKDPDGSRVTINDMVEQQTNGRIKDLIPSGLIKTDTRLVLTNAVYFKGDWARRFNSTLTKEADFRPESGPAKKVQMMHSSEDFNYTEADGIQVLELPYSGNDLSMLILLPKEGELGQLESSLSSEKLEAWRQGLRTEEVQVYVPKFRLETSYQLKHTLQGMGMGLAFSPSANFSGIAENERLMISEVVHKAFVEVDEKGTEAAAATAVIIVKTSVSPGGQPPMPVFRADHPFIFVIQEKSTGNILFMGRVADPAAG